MASGATHLVRGTLRAAAARLAPFRIERVHRIRLVNVRRITEVEARPSGDLQLRLDTGDVVAGSRRYRDRIQPGGAARMARQAAGAGGG